MPDYAQGVVAYVLKGIEDERVDIDVLGPTHKSKELPGSEQEALDLVFQAVPLTHCAILAGPDGKPYAWFRVRKIPLSHIKTTWKKGTLSTKREQQLKREKGDKQTDVEILEAVVQEHSKGPYAYCRYVIDKEEEHMIYKREMEGIGSRPDLTARWSTSSNEVYGRGVLLQALPSIKTVNLVRQLILENAEWAIAGMYFYDDDGILLGHCFAERAPRLVCPDR